jgi:phosphohistidine phosphatase
MPLSLYVLRHAKAERDGLADDHARPLKKRGRRAAQAIGRFLTRIEEEPELVLSSSALRARETAELAMEAGRWRAALELDRRLYLAEPETLLRAAAEVEGSRRLLIVGHQPGLSLLIGLLCAGREPAFPTGALARVDLDLGRWSELAPGAGWLCWLVTPALIGAGQGPDD